MMSDGERLYGLLMDLGDVTGDTADGVHVASAAGVWQALVHGFGGVRDHDGELSIDPRLPSSWRSLAFSLRLRGRLLRVEIGRDEERYTLEAGDPLEITVRGERRRISGDAAVTAPGSDAQTAATGDRRVRS